MTEPLLAQEDLPGEGEIVPETQSEAEVDAALERLAEGNENVAAVPARIAERKAPRAAVANQVTSLDFRTDGPISRIVIGFQSRPAYRETRNDQVKQIVYLFENTETPQRLQRAYDTTEFSSPIALFTMLQMPQGGPPQSKLIVQLREGKVPTVSMSDRGMTITFPSSDYKVEPRAATSDSESPMGGEENIYASGKTFNGKPIQRLEIKNSDIQDVLRLIAKTSGYNIVVGDDVQGKVGTLSLENVPWDQAFTLVLQSKKLGYVRHGNVLRVGTLSSLKAEKEEALANELSRIKVEQLRTLLVPISYAKAADLAPRGKSLLTDRGAIEVDTRTNTIIVKDIDKVVTRVQKLFAALDTQPPRVSISAKIVEMLSSFTRTIGFSHIGLSQNFSGVNLTESIDIKVAGNSTTTISAPNFANLQTIFQMGELENKVKILANPSVSVTANQQATVNQSVSFFIPTAEIAGGVVITTLKQVTANLSLDVTPVVAGDGSISMTVNIKNEIPRGPLTEKTIDTRSVSTNVLIENGDTAVIGGVFNNTFSTAKEGVPFLMRVPILGFFFSGNSIEDTRNEIYVFLTAKILNPEESFKRTF